MGKFVKFNNDTNKVVIGQQEFDTKKVNTNIDVYTTKLENGYLPPELDTYKNTAVAKIDKMVELDAEAIKALAKKRTESRARNIDAEFTRWGGEPYQDGVATAFRNMMTKLKDYFKTRGITLHLKNYTTTKNAPQWFVYKDKNDRNAQGLPLSVNRFIRKYQSTLDSWTIKALKALARLNSSMKMWKSYAKNMWNLENNLKDPEKAKVYVASRFRKRVKQVARKVARANKVGIDKITTDVIKAQYDMGAVKAAEGADKLAQSLKRSIKMKNDAAGVVSLTNFGPAPKKDEVPKKPSIVDMSKPGMDIELKL